MSENKYKPETIAIHGGYKPDGQTARACTVPIVQSASFVFRDTEHAANLFDLKEFGDIYSRLTNPTVAAWEARMAELEGGTAGVGTSSGMAAIFLTIHTIAGVGDHIIASASLYGGTDTLFRYTLPQVGIECDFVPNADPEKIKSAVKPNTKAIYIETIGNPACEVPDFETIAKIAHDAGVPLIVDNTFAPIICRPFDYGADIVIHSCTKWVGGHGTTIGGVTIDGGTFDWSASGKYPMFTEPDKSYHGVKYWDVFGNLNGANIAFAIRARTQGLRNWGPCASPFSAFQFMVGLDSLGVRIQRHCENAAALVAYLQKSDKVEWVQYAGLESNPSYANAKKYLKGGFGSVISFGIKGGRDAGEKFINSVELAYHLANVGDSKTLVIHPASTTHRQMNDAELETCGIKPGSIRVSVGIEHIDDIIADIDQAINKAI